MGTIKALNTTGKLPPTKNLTMRFLSALPTKYVHTDAKNVASVPNIISNKPLPNVLLIKQPIVKPKTASGQNSGKIVINSEILTCTAPKEIG